MYHTEIVEHLAMTNALAGRPKRLEDIDAALPYFELYRDGLGRSSIRGFNYAGHDNAPRMQFWEAYMRAKILPHLHAKTDGFYNIELHDSYTYLNNGRSYGGCLAFTKRLGDARPVLIPDCPACPMRRPCAASSKTIR